MSENVENTAAQNMDMFEQRTAKIREYQEAGVNPFGGAFPDVELIESVRTREVPAPESGLPAPEAVIAGRMTAKRGMGKSLFADVRDSSGRLQLFAGKSDMSEEMFALCRKLDIGDIVGVKGTLFITKTGELTLRVKEITLLSKSMRPLPEKFHGLVDVEQRYRQRSR